MTIFHGAAGRDGGRWKREIQKVFFFKNGKNKGEKERRKKTERLESRKK